MYLLFVIVDVFKSNLLLLPETQGQQTYWEENTKTIYISTKTGQNSRFNVKIRTRYNVNPL